MLPQLVVCGKGMVQQHARLSLAHAWPWAAVSPPSLSLAALHTGWHLPLMAGSDGSVALVQALGCSSTPAPGSKLLPGGHLCQQGMPLLHLSLHSRTPWKT